MKNRKLTVRVERLMGTNDKLILSSTFLTNKADPSKEEAAEMTRLWKLLYNPRAGGQWERSFIERWTKEEDYSTTTN